MTTLRTLTVHMQHGDAIHYLNLVDDTGRPWHLVGVADYEPNTLQLFVDGGEEPLEITLHPDGSWTSTLTVTVPVH